MAGRKGSDRLREDLETIDGVPVESKMTDEELLADALREAAEWVAERTDPRRKRT